MQTDTLNIPDSNGQVYRLAVNEALQALATEQAGDTAPLETYPYMVWKDTSVSPAVKRVRNAANTSWEIPAFSADVISETTAGAGVTVDGLLIKDGEVPSTNPDTLSIATLTGSERIALKQSGSWLRTTVQTITDFVAAALRPSTFTDSGALTGTEVLTGDRSGYIGITANRIAAFVTGVYTITVTTGVGAAARTLLDILRDRPVSIRNFGADPTGVADSTSAILAAAAVSNLLYIPQGTYLFSTLAFTGPVSLYGDGEHLSFLETSTTTGNAITYSAGASLVTGIVIKDLQVGATSLRTSGFGISFESTTGAFFNTSLRNLEFGSNMCSSINLSGAMFYTYLNDVDINYVGTNGSGVFAEGESRPSRIIAELKMTNVNVRAGTNDSSSRGFNLRDRVDGVYAERCQAEGSLGYGLVVGRLSGGDAIPCRDLWFTNCVFDYAKTINVYLPSAQNINFIGSWTSSSRGNGLDIGAVAGCNILQHTAIGNASTGVTLGSSSSGVTIQNSLICGNGTATNNTYADLEVKPGASNFQIGWNQFQRAGQTNTAAYNVSVNYGSSDNYIISHNIAKSGLTANILDSGLGTSKIVANNLA